MIRASVTIPKLLPKLISVPRREIHVSNVLKSSGIPPSPKKGSILKKLIALTLVSGGGIVGYSWYDQEFRKLLAENVPYAKDIFDTLFEYLPAKEGVSKMYAEYFGAEEVKPVPFIKKEPQPVVVEKTKKDTEVDKRREAEILLKEKKESEAKRIIDIEKGLERKVEGVRGVVASLMEACRTATEVTKQHCDKLKLALQATDDSKGEWEEVVVSQERKVQVADVYERLEAEARQELQRLQDELSQLKSDQSLKGSKLISSAVANAETMAKQLNSAAKQFSRAQSEAKVFSEYKDLVKKGKERFKKELEAIMPGHKPLPASFSKMNEEELNALIGHAHKRVDQLQKRLAEQEALEQVRITDAVERQKEEDMLASRMSVDSEKDEWRRQLQVLKSKWNLVAKGNFEEELRVQMIRQASAHNDHINEVLRGQQRDLEAKHALLLDESLQGERRLFQSQVAAWVARMQGVEEAVEKRAQFEEQSHQVQRLWLACEALQAAIATGNAGASTWQGRLKPLAPEVNLIKQSFPDQPAIRAILDTIPEVALSRGVWTEGGLMERFKKVDKVCRRVAMVDETAGVNGSLFRYFLSSFQSKLVVPGVSKIYEKEDDVVEKEELENVFFLLDNAQASLDRGDLVQAVRFANQLTGEPRRVISDWLNEARLLLETKQLSTALLASASAAGFSSLAATS